MQTGKAKFAFKSTYVCIGIFNFGSLQCYFELREKQVGFTRRPGTTKGEKEQHSVVCMQSPSYQVNVRHEYV